MSKGNLVFLVWSFTPALPSVVQNLISEFWPGVFKVHLANKVNPLNYNDGPDEAERHPIMTEGFCLPFVCHIKPSAALYHVTRVDCNQFYMHISYIELQT